MRTGVAIAVGAFACLLTSSAGAHRIDEYLQATMLSLQAQRIHASMRLVPGILVAPSVIGEIDRDHDGVISQTEARAYAQRVLDDLTLTIDGTHIRPRLVAWQVPMPAQM